MPKTAAEIEAKQLNGIFEQIGSITMHSTFCVACHRPEEDDDTGIQQFAKELYDDGWRVCDSKKLNITDGIMCPQCVATTDEQRGKTRNG